ncbi:MAG: hypothetical protein K2N25_02855, partial [Muribaculaceae bacterium]|nr:hypothetical protein [Muribaculaceae bacterium]
MIDLKIHKTISENGEVYNIIVNLVDEFKGIMSLNDDFIRDHNLKAYVSSDSIIYLTPLMDANGRSCMFSPAVPVTDHPDSIIIPSRFFEVIPSGYVEVDEIDIDEDMMLELSIAGAWHKKGYEWKDKAGMFSIIDDDSLDGQISSSVPITETYGYFSILYPLLESLGLMGNLAAEGRRIGLNQIPPRPNDNLKTIRRLQDEKGWEILSHSMDCMGERLNNWLVDSLNSTLANEIFATGPNNGVRSTTVSVYDLKTKKQYWPNSDNTSWTETPSRFIKPYVGDYSTKKEVMYNPDFDIDWHWGEWKRAATECGIDPKGFVTHNSTSSHAMVPGIMRYFPQGFSDIAAKNINTIPMLSTAVRSGLEGQSMKGYDGSSKDNTFNTEQFNAFCSQIDEAAEIGGWIMFNLHAYRDCWKNSLPGMLVSEGGSYPDEWVIPMKGIDSANDPLTPPACLGISDWSEWYPCPGTRLDMMWQILKYAKQKGLINVTSSEGFKAMGNKKAAGYFNNGYKFGMDDRGIVGTRDIYPHYVVAANDEVFYYNTLITDEISKDIDILSVKTIGDEERFVRYGSQLSWSSNGMPYVTLKVFDMSGKEIGSSHSNMIDLKDFSKGTYIV